MPLRTMLETPSGQYKTTIVDRVEGMEPTLAHLLPEMTSNLLVPVSIAVYIFVLDWRMGLASLVTTVIGFAVASQSGKTYAARKELKSAGFHWDPESSNWFTTDRKVAEYFC